jgi:alpha-tubulin suppressor-like RCC1 family protein
MYHESNSRRSLRSFARRPLLAFKACGKGLLVLVVLVFAAQLLIIGCGSTRLEKDNDAGGKAGNDRGPSDDAGPGGSGGAGGRSGSGGAGGTGGGGKTYSVGGTVTGLQGTGLMLRNNGRDDLPISTDGSFTFTKALADRSSYAVTIATQPSGTNRTCTVENGTGMLTSADVTNVKVSCVERPVTIIFFEALPNVVFTGGSVTFSWATWAAVSCEINPGAVEALPTSSGSVVVAVNAETDFVLTCKGPGGPVSSAPVKVGVSDSGWADVSAGIDHTCAINMNGKLFCWGNNGVGQLGNNSTTDSHVPVQESTGATDWARVSAGWSHTCAIKTDRKLFCWGTNSHNQLGNNSTSGYSPEPVQESTGATDWVDVSAGGGHTCAIKTNGTLFCWGYDYYGQGGDNSLFADSRVPVQESTDATDWARVSAGGVHSCAIKTNGTVFCWGYNGGGQLGTNLIDLSSIPVQESTRATDWARVSAGDASTCAIKTNGTLFCWGPVLIQESTSATDWAGVSAGYRHTCALKTDGTLFCWGHNEYGQLGNNSNTNSPVPVQESTSATDWANLSVGGHHTCANKTDGKLFCWGDNEYGQLGDNSTTNSPVPIRVSITATD